MMTAKELYKALRFFKGCNNCDVRVNGQHIKEVKFKSLNGTWPNQHDNLVEQTVNYIDLEVRK